MPRSHPLVLALLLPLLLAGVAHAALDIDAARRDAAGNHAALQAELAEIDRNLADLDRDRAIAMRVIELVTRDLAAVVDDDAERDRLHGILEQYMQRRDDAVARCGTLERQREPLRVAAERAAKRAATASRVTDARERASARRVDDARRARLLERATGDTRSVAERLDRVQRQVDAVRAEIDRLEADLRSLRRDAD